MRLGLKLSLLVSVGALALAGCGSGQSKADQATDDAFYKELASAAAKNKGQATSKQAKRNVPTIKDTPNGNAGSGGTAPPRAGPH